VVCPCVSKRRAARRRRSGIRARARGPESDTHPPYKEGAFGPRKSTAAAQNLHNPSKRERSGGAMSVSCRPVGPELAIRPDIECHRLERTLTIAWILVRLRYCAGHLCSSPAACRAPPRAGRAIAE
jgi:hypothetical protein